MSALIVRMFVEDDYNDDDDAYTSATEWNGEACKAAQIQCSSRAESGVDERTRFAQ